jgi:hypothetical protein
VKVFPFPLLSFKPKFWRKFVETKSKLWNSLKGLCYTKHKYRKFGNVHRSPPRNCQCRKCGLGLVGWNGWLKHRRAGMRNSSKRYVHLLVRVVAVVR